METISGKQASSTSIHVLTHGPNVASDEIPVGSKRTSHSDGLSTEDNDVERSGSSLNVANYIAGWELVGLVASLTLACFLILLDVSILVTAIPRIIRDFHSHTDVGWWASMYNLSIAVFLPLSGKVYTCFHVKWTFLAFFLMFEIGSLISGLATSSVGFIIGRAIAGIGTSGIQTGAFAIIVASAPLAKRPFLLGVMMGVCQVGLGSGPLVGGALTEYMTWRRCFLINLPIGAICVVLILLVRIPDRRSQQDMQPNSFSVSQLDLPGFFLLALFATMVLLTLQFGGQILSWTSTTVIGLICGGGAAFMAFVAWECRVGDGAMIPLALIRKRQVWMSCLSMMLLFSTILASSYYLAVYFESVKGMTPFNSAVSSLPVVMSQLVGSILSGYFVQRIGYYLPVMLACAILTVTGHYLLSTLSLDSNSIRWAGYQILLGLSRGAGLQMPIVAINAHSPPSLTSLATSTLLFFQTFGGSVFISVAISLFNNRLRQELLARVPEPDVGRIMHAGAIGIDKVVPKETLTDVLTSYCRGVSAVFYLLVATSGCLCLTSCGMGWTDIRKCNELGRDES